MVLFWRSDSNRQKSQAMEASVKNNHWYKKMAFYQIWPRSFMDGNKQYFGTSLACHHRRV